MRISHVVLSLALLAQFLGCAGHPGYEKIRDEEHLEIMLRSQTNLLGDPANLQHFEHPATISQAQLKAILRGIQIIPGNRRYRDDRAPEQAIAEELIGPIAEGLEEAFWSATSDQEISVSAVTKSKRRKNFHRKYVTSFTTYIKGGELYVLLYRINWGTIRLKPGDPLPVPWPGDEVMDFIVVANEPYQEVEPQVVKVDWRSVGENTPPAPALADQVGSLSLESLRELVLLEEAHDEGLIDYDSYLQQRQRILDGLR
jgi:hypothetical protein